MTPDINQLLGEWNLEQDIHIDTAQIFSNQKYIPENMRCRARTWTGRCSHRKCQSGIYPHLCQGCANKAMETPIPNSFESNDSSLNGTPPKRIGLKFGTIDTPITELIFAPNGEIATVWPNPEVRNIVSQALEKGIPFHSGSKEARDGRKGIQKIKLEKSNTATKTESPTTSNDDNEPVQKKTIKLKIKAPNTNNNIITQLPQKNKIKIKIKKPSQQPTQKSCVQKRTNIKFIKPATFRADGTVDFGFDDESEDEDTPEVEDGEDPIEFLQNEIQQAGGITKVKLPQLKSWLSIIGLSTSGNKKTLQHRITTWMEGDESDTDSEDED